MLKEIVILSLVAFATCSLVGGFEDANVDDEDVRTAAEHAASILTKIFKSPFHHKLVKVVKAKKQVVAGMNYRLDVVMGLTNCKKSEVEFENVKECELQDSVSTYKKCEVLVYRNLKNYHKLIRSGCVLISKNDV